MRFNTLIHVRRDRYLKLDCRIKKPLTVILLLICFLTVVKAENVQASTETTTILQSTGNITYPPVSAGFDFPGATLCIKVFYPGCIDYKSNIFTTLSNMGITTVRVYGAGFDKFLFSQSDWATQLKSFLDLIGSHNMKVVFHQLGSWKDPSNNDWAFGIKPQDGITAAKAKIDMLAGNNSLSYNFITDPRVSFWIILNEPFLDYTTSNGVNIADYCRAIGTYIQSKGGKATIGYGSVESGNATPSKWVPLIRDWADYIIAHWYPIEEALSAQNIGQSVYNAVYNSFSSETERFFVQMNGFLPKDALLIGEAGIQRYENSGASEDTRGEFYHAMFQALRDKGAGGIFPFTLIDLYNVPETWGAIGTDGTLFTKLTDQYNAYY